MVEACPPLLNFRRKQVNTVCRVKGAGLGAPSWLASIPPPRGHDAPRLGVLWVRVAPGVRSHTVGIVSWPPAMWIVGANRGSYVRMYRPMHLRADVCVGAWVGIGLLLLLVTRLDCLRVAPLPWP